MGSRHPPRPYDKATLAALEQAFSDAWAVLEARDPLRDWVKDGQLSSNLSEKLMALADKGSTKPDELCKRALKGLPRRSRGVTTGHPQCVRDCSPVAHIKFNVRLWHIAD